MINYNLGVQVENRYNLTDFAINAGVNFKHSTGLTTGPREIISVGLTYTTTQKISLLFGVNISSDFRIEYAYDLNLLPGYYQNSTNEIMFEYRIPVKDGSLCTICQKNGNWYD